MKNSIPPTDLQIRLLKTMMLIRTAEQRLASEFKAGNLPGGVHLSLGQEAVATGVCAVLQPDDQITSTHRGHGHLIAKGGDIGGMFAEIYGKASGICRGMGGSMHVADFSRGIIGAKGIVGAGIPIATGAAFADQLAGNGRISVCFFGDGAANQRVLMECLNLASLWQLPLVFVCENNGFSEFSPSATVTCGKVSDRALPFGIPVQNVDGNDVIEVWHGALWATEHARCGQGPVFLEMATYRMANHFELEPLVIKDPYRSAEEIEAWQARDPIERLANALTGGGALSTSEFGDLASAAADLVNQAVEQAESAPDADVQAATSLMFSNDPQGAGQCPG